MSKVVIDLGFGDSGKGLVVDYLCSKADGPVIVVRFTGGQQAGHTVMIGSKKHVHSSYGSGTLRGHPSYFTEHCSIYLNSLKVEQGVLYGKGVTPRLYVHPLAKITTPYDVAYNMITEEARKHGSCGLGIGATMRRHFQTPYKLVASDLFHFGVFTRKLQAILEYYQDFIREDWREKFVSYYTGRIEPFLENAAFYTKLFFIEDYSYLKRGEQLIFEGAQGVLLDMDHSVFPNVTYGYTTSRNAMEVLQKLGETGKPDMYYVTRCYQTRHGVGWMTKEKDVTLVNTQEEINKYNEWQEHFRVGELDYTLLNYSAKVDSLYSKVNSPNLVVTCLDQRPGFTFDYTQLAFTPRTIYNSYSPDSQNLKQV